MAIDSAFKRRSIGPFGWALSVNHKPSTGLDSSTERRSASSNYGFAATVVATGQSRHGGVQPIDRSSNMRTLGSLRRQWEAMERDV